MVDCGRGCGCCWIYKEMKANFHRPPPPCPIHGNWEDNFARDDANETANEEEPLSKCLNKLNVDATHYPNFSGRKLSRLCTSQWKCCRYESFYPWWCTVRRTSSNARNLCDFNAFPQSSYTRPVTWYYCDGLFSGETIKCTHTNTHTCIVPATNSIHKNCEMHQRQIMVPLHWETAMCSSPWPVPNRRRQGFKCAFSALNKSYHLNTI